MLPLFDIQPGFDARGMIGRPGLNSRPDQIRQAQLNALDTCFLSEEEKESLQKDKLS